MMTLLRFHNRSMVIADEAMTRTLDLANRAANSQAAVLLCGESGTGKELIARYIHDKSRRAKAAFVSVNCAAIPEGLMEAELFGFERGAFTGAVQQRIGKFERASGGTLLLDEVSEMSTALQAKLLRVLQEGELDRLGAKEPIAIDTRIIATTNRDLQEQMSRDRFRHDLFYRLNVIRIDCAPLRGRAQMIGALAGDFIRQASQRAGLESLVLTPRALQKLRDHAWPGNIRELQNVIERAVVLCDGKTLEEEHLEIIEKSQTSVTNVKLADVEKEHILEVLTQAQGSRVDAAKALGISIRTLRNKLKEYSGA